jgi:hypothetical protein
MTFFAGDDVFLPGMMFLWPPLLRARATIVLQG